MSDDSERRLQRLEDQLSIYQLVNGYGYAMDGMNAEVVADCYVEDGVYAVGDMGTYVGSARIGAITQDPTHLAFVAAGCAHISTVPHVVIDGDEAIATCHTMVATRGPDGFFIGRLSASRIHLARQPEGAWRIVHRQNYLLDGKPEGPSLLGRLKEGPQSPKGGHKGGEP